MLKINMWKKNCKDTSLLCWKITFILHSDFQGLRNICLTLLCYSCCRHRKKHHEITELLRVSGEKVCVQLAWLPSLKSELRAGTRKSQHVAGLWRESVSTLLWFLSELWNRGRSQGPSQERVRMFVRVCVHIFGALVNYWLINLWLITQALASPLSDQ